MLRGIVSVWVTSIHSFNIYLPSALFLVEDKLVSKRNEDINSTVDTDSNKDQ